MCCCCFLFFWYFVLPLIDMFPGAPPPSSVMFPSGSARSIWQSARASHSSRALASEVTAGPSAGLGMPMPSPGNRRHACFDSAGAGQVHPGDPAPVSAEAANSVLPGDGMQRRSSSQHVAGRRAISTSTPHTRPAKKDDG